MSEAEQEIEDFLARLRARLHKGAAEYGDVSFERHPVNTAHELLEEVEDVAGWAFVAWVQLRRRLRRVLAAEARLLAQGQQGGRR